MAKNMDKLMMLACAALGVLALMYFFDFMSGNEGYDQDDVNQMHVGNNIGDYPEGGPSPSGNLTGPAQEAPRPAEPNAFDSVGAEVSGLGSASSKYCFPMPGLGDPVTGNQQLQTEDLLPKDQFDQWAQLHPQGEGYLTNKNFLTGGHHIGINTVGNNLRNPNLQIRSEPVNPQVPVSPWINSTIGKDLYRKPLEACENTYWEPNQGEHIKSLC